jgi:hypothetical protein
MHTLQLISINFERKAMRKTLGVFLLALIFACPVSAGIMGNGSPEPPPSQPATATQGPTTDGEMDTGLTAPTADGETSNNATTIIEVLLNLLALP